MKENLNLQELKQYDFRNPEFSKKLLDQISRLNLWNLWVPKSYGGLEFSFSEGLQVLQKLARIDGSLGWTITLCSGANYFIGNLKPEAAKEIFVHPSSTILGGSGGVFGTAEKQGGNYKISGTWKYATGAPYLSHFTLNAKITENGEVLRDENGDPKIRSFVIPSEKVEIIDDWTAMGLKASATQSFRLKDIIVPENQSFIYNEFYLPQPIFKIPFAVFADLTLWVNYIGMATHFLSEAEKLKEAQHFKKLKTLLVTANKKIAHFASAIEQTISTNESPKQGFREEIHLDAATSVKQISAAIIEIYPKLGIAACSEDHSINQIFRDYFTATQHHIFTKKQNP
ncbi:acyl-CoA dehydrogenase family protein [Salegentibacter sp. HM20]